jgi:hypothetical protein
MNKTTNLQVGDVVAYCYSGSNGTRRLRNVAVTKVAKTFIEIEGGTRFSPIDGRMTRDSNGGSGIRSYYIDPQTSYWDSKDQREQAIRQLNSGFENLMLAARDRNWEQVKSCFTALTTLIDE